jgi:hypothetical protein
MRLLRLYQTRLLLWIARTAMRRTERLHLRVRA